MPVNWYEIIQNSELGIRNLELSDHGIMHARKITSIAKREGFITEVNTQSGSIEIFDNDFNRIAEAIRIYI